MNHDELDRRFDFHPIGDDPKRAQDHQDIRVVMKVAANSVLDICPDGREKSLAITKLEEAMYWANAAIARPAPESPF